MAENATESLNVLQISGESEKSLALACCFGVIQYWLTSQECDHNTKEARSTMPVQLPSDHRFYRALLKGVIAGRTVINTFYAGRSDGSPFEFSAAGMREFAEQLVFQVLPAYLETMAQQYEAESIVVSLIDEYNQNRGFFDVEVPVSGVGARNGTRDGNGPCAIVGFSCSPVTDTQDYRVPKGTYIAVGPLGSAYIADTGELAGGITPFLEALGDAIADFTYITSSDAWTVTSMRVGTPNKYEIGAAGKIDEGIVRPYASVRRSRMTPPKGE